MDALQKAKELIEDAWVVDEGDLAEQLKRQDAAIYAAIAQAEQLKRIADMLQGTLDKYGTLTVITAQPEF